MNATIYPNEALGSVHVEIDRVGRSHALGPRMKGWLASWMTNGSVTAPARYIVEWSDGPRYMPEAPLLRVWCDDCGEDACTNVDTFEEAVGFVGDHEHEQHERTT
jgi:hypothetical protein